MARAASDQGLGSPERSTSRSPGLARTASNELGVIGFTPYCCVATARGPMKRLRRLKRSFEVFGNVSRSFFRFLVIVIMNSAELPWLPINADQAKKNDQSRNQRSP